MIRYALACEAGHEFEGWFSGSDDYDVQAASGLLTCPVCDTREVRKQIMAPAVSGTSRQAAPANPQAMRAMMAEVMTKVRAHVETHFDYVGDRFATEARAIHQGESQERGIYGQASPAEVKALVADGVPVAPLPPGPPKKSEIN
jgi:hypothetical protein